jgi:hypothetical protein
MGAPFNSEIRRRTASFGGALFQEGVHVFGRRFVTRILTDQTNVFTWWGNLAPTFLAIEAEPTTDLSSFPELATSCFN